jgi:hypothetical protein
MFNSSIVSRQHVGNPIAPVDLDVTSASATSFRPISFAIFETTSSVGPGVWTRLDNISPSNSTVYFFHDVNSSQ